MTDTESEVEKFLETYATEFSTGDPKIVASHFDTPAFVFAPDGNRALATREDVASLFDAVFDDLAARDYGHSELASMAVRPIGADRALAAVHWVRRTIEGDILEELGTTHLLRRTDDGWKMAAIVPGSPGDLPLAVD